MNIFLTVVGIICLVIYFCQLVDFLAKVDCDRITTKRQFWEGIIPFVSLFIMVYHYYKTLK